MWSGVGRGMDGTFMNPVGLLLLSNQYGEGDNGQHHRGHRRELAGGEAGHDPGCSWRSTTCRSRASTIPPRTRTAGPSPSPASARWESTCPGRRSTPRLRTSRSARSTPSDNFEDAGVGVGRGYPDMDYLSLSVSIPVMNHWMISPDAVFQRQGPSRITDPAPTDPDEHSRHAGVPEQADRVWLPAGRHVQRATGSLRHPGLGRAVPRGQRGQRRGRERHAVRGQDPGAAAHRQAGSAQVMRDARPLTRARAAEIVGAVSVAHGSRSSAT